MGAPRPNNCVQFSLLCCAGLSMQHHYLASYLASLKAILAVQFTTKASTHLETCASC